jgi:hypothetical protein
MEAAGPTDSLANTCQTEVLHTQKINLHEPSGDEIVKFPSMKTHPKKCGFNY